MGTNEEEGRQMLRNGGVEVSQSLDEGAAKAVEIARGS
jgi:succinyl-CoA synthetase beta subunit